MQIYTRPTYEELEIKLADHSKAPMAPYNMAVRAGVTALYIALVTLICCMFPFFGDFLALVGAIGFTPLDFVMPIIMFWKVRKTSVAWKAINFTLAFAYTGVGIVGAVGALYFIQDKVHIYSVFADL